MSYAIEFTGTVDEIGKKFDETRDSCASYGMIEPEQRDIDEARDLAMQFASKYGRVAVSASGHWNARMVDGPIADGSDGLTHSFGRCSITLSHAPTPIENKSE